MPRRAALLALVLALAGPWAPGCGGPGDDASRAALATARTRFDAKDWSGALAAARDGLSARPGDPDLGLVAALACVRLDRASEAIEFADAGLAAPGVAPDLSADLQWARGASFMRRYLELKQLEDWRAANDALEQASKAGGYRLEAATALAALQDLSALGSDERMARYARVVRSLAPGSPSDQQITALMARKGLSY